MTGDSSSVNSTSNGYGYVKLKSVDLAQKAVTELNNVDWQGEKLIVERFDKDKKNNSLTNVYVKEFPLKWTEGDLKDFFSDIGEMQSVVIMKDEKNISKGFGFVNFKTPDLATKAVKKH